MANRKPAPDDTLGSRQRRQKMLSHIRGSELKSDKKRKSTNKQTRKWGNKIKTRKRDPNE